MCLIVDVNVATRVLIAENDCDYGIVRKALLAGRTTLVYGGRLTDEYLKVEAIKRILVTLDRAGRARAVPRTLVDKEEATIKKSALCLSNDEHIIALARASKTRLLCSHDKLLQKDFTNKSLLDKPRGKVFQNTAHKRLLDQSCDLCI